MHKTNLLMERITHYFPSLSEEQIRQLEMLDSLYHDWNSKINVISRKDIDNLYEHHVMHSMSIAKALRFTPGTRIMDFGCGGGFPGIPLAIIFPECTFKLIDRTAKKIRVCQEIIKALGLKNVIAEQKGGEEEKALFDFIVSRAVMPLPDLVKIVKKNIDRKNQQNAMPNGIFCLKGGELQQEILPFKNIVEKTDLTLYFKEEWYKGKYLVYLPV